MIPDNPFYDVRKESFFINIKGNRNHFLFFCSINRKNTMIGNIFHHFIIIIVHCIDLLFIISVLFLLSDNACCFHHHTFCILTEFSAIGDIFRNNVTCTLKRFFNCFHLIIKIFFSHIFK